MSYGAFDPGLSAYLSDNEQAAPQITVRWQWPMGLAGMAVVFACMVM